MSLKVIYVEDTAADVEVLQEAFTTANAGSPEWSQLVLIPVVHPSALPAALGEYPDVVLADVMFLAAGASLGTRPVDHLDEIIQHVKNWDRMSPHGFPTPVIAYTGTGPVTLKSCLDRRGHLYDIWDKLSAGADYVSWRFQQLARELPRYRPDATIQKLVAAMPQANCPNWHPHVLKMVKRYGEGQTEYEQVQNCSDPLQSILTAVCPKHAVALMALWSVLVKSEPLLRAASPRVRGIARHSINVFWLGYWLINHPLLQNAMRDLWSKMIQNRVQTSIFNSSDPLVGINTVWVLASVFHDAGKYHEKGKAVTKASQEFYREFASLSLGNVSWAPNKPRALPKSLQDLLCALRQTRSDPLVKQLTAHIQDTWSHEIPDHGAVAAAHLVNVCADTSTPLLAAYAAEAARATLLHSSLPGAFDRIPKDLRGESPHLEWERDPIASLLLFCDQIQTWDRHDPNDHKRDYPDRAELSFLELTPSGGKITLKGCVNYIAPTRVDMYPELRTEIAEALNKVLLEKPKDTLLHILEAGKWPFSVHLDCALSGERLPMDMSFD